MGWKCHHFEKGQFIVFSHVTTAVTWRKAAGDGHSHRETQQKPANLPSHVSLDHLLAKLLALSLNFYFLQPKFPKSWDAVKNINKNKRPNEYEKPVLTQASHIVFVLHSVEYRCKGISK